MSENDGHFAEPAAGLLGATIVRFEQYIGALNRRIAEMERLIAFHRRIVDEVEVSLDKIKRLSTRSPPG